MATFDLGPMDAGYLIHACNRTAEELRAQAARRDVSDRLAIDAYELAHYYHRLADALEAACQQGGAT